MSNAYAQLNRLGESETLVEKGFHPFFAIEAGTGGYPKIPDDKPRDFEKIVNIRNPNLNRIDIVAPMQQLKFIREIFSLNITELANLFGVTRPTMYSWLQGQDLKKQDVLSNVDRFYKIGQHLKGLQIARFNTLLHRPIFHGKSFYDKLKNETELMESLQLLKNISDKEAGARLKPKGSGKNNDSINPSDYSIRLYPD